MQLGMTPSTPYIAQLNSIDDSLVQYAGSDSPNILHDHYGQKLAQSLQWSNRCPTIRACRTARIRLVNINTTVMEGQILQCVPYEAFD